MVSIDDPSISRRVFFPRKTRVRHKNHEGIIPVLLPVTKDINISGRFFFHAHESPVILFFHGNGEVSADYESIGLNFGVECGVNFLVMDYRGYGESTGSPSISTMLADACTLFPLVQQYLSEKGLRGPNIVMGRSLGSAAAIVIAMHYAPSIAGLILESGFARGEPLLELFGVPLLGISQESLDSLANVEKIKNISLPLLVIHGQEDSLIPVNNGQDLYAASPVDLKRIIIIPEAEHNTILLYPEYFPAIKEFLTQIVSVKK